MPDAIEKFFQSYTDEVAELASTLRETITSSLPDASEKLQLGWKCVTYSQQAPFCAILPHAKWVNLQFHKGAELDDPGGLLEGTGKSMRHIKVRTREDISKALVELVVRASKHAS